MEHRLVHLDLKGAPPIVKYYEKLFPLIKKCGATGLLIEYEDMFPYSGKLQDIAAHNAYSAEEVKRILELATENDLITIPLIQTFGHFEFVLKHDNFRKLREVEEFPMTLCPSNYESLWLVKQMIDQVIAAHPDSRWFHIGADEVFHLGVCADCKKHMESNGLTPEQLFFSHVHNVLLYLKDQYPDIKPIMWEDMFRETSLKRLQDSGIGDLVEPMVWHYLDNFCLPADIWERYSAVFDSIWAASAFKGATGVCAFVTDINYHLSNHKSWIDVVNTQIRPRFNKFHGYAVTGWQRYDHYAVMCELLPVGLPSLALCLKTLCVGGFTLEVHTEVTQLLKFSKLITLNPYESSPIAECQFPGSDVFKGVHRYLVLKTEYNVFFQSDRVCGWFTEYHIKHNYANPAHLNFFTPHVSRILAEFKSLQVFLENCLPEVFYLDAVEEWIAVHITPKVKKLTKTKEIADRLGKYGAKPKCLKGTENSDMDCE